uniref:replication helicase subunit n=1 Tax=Hypnea musciformis TaxID=31429 RepID=UPI0027DA0F8C|nr:replication helicase subunit [Hypnea musciformis]WCH57001.1 replication helicase subunit [Hypnea musciformis]
MNHLYQDLIPPNNYIAEEIIIGYIIINPSVQKNLLQNIDSEYFFLESHKLFYLHLKKIHNKNKINFKNVFNIINDNSKISHIITQKTIIKFIKQGQIFNRSENTKFYINQLLKLIYENYIKRLFIQYSYNIINLSYNHKISIHKISLQASLYLNKINKKLEKQNLDNSHFFVSELFQDLTYNRKKIKNSEIIIKSGFQYLDKITTGLPSGDLIIIAGRPSTGKTSFLINIAYNILEKFDTQICIFSLEMTRKQILQKIISIGSAIPLYLILQGEINIQEWNKIVKICQKILISKIYINDSTNISIENILNTCKTICKEINNKTIIFIDYLQLINSQYSTFFNRNEELSYITRKLKITAQLLKIPIVVLSQLNRRIETRINKKPLLSDLKESGCISYILFIYNNNKHKINIICNNDCHTLISSYINYITNDYDLFHYLQYINNFIQKISLFTEYIFNYTIYNHKQLKLTENHPILQYNIWIQTRHIEQNNTINQYKNILNNIYKRIKKSHISITFLSYSLVYEISKKEYCNFNCQNFILHNSIEQDADIIIMLYSNDTNNQEEYLSKRIIDINILKNRNGITGSLQLLFNLSLTKFKDKNNKSIK